MACGLTDPHGIVLLSVAFESVTVRNRELWSVYPFQSQNIHKITEQAFVWYRVDQAAVVAWQRNEPRPQSRSLQRWCSRCSSNAAQRENATTPTDSWDTTNTYITSYTLLWLFFFFFFFFFFK